MMDTSGGATTPHPGGGPASQARAGGGGIGAVVYICGGSEEYLEINKD